MIGLKAAHSGTPRTSTIGMESLDSHAAVRAILALIERSPGNLAELRQKWSVRAQLVVAAAGPASLTNAADLVGEFLADVAAIEAAHADQLLTYEEASHETGFSTRHLSRLAERGLVEYTGDNRNRRFRRGSLPIKAGGDAEKPDMQAPPVAPASDGAYDPIADARRLRQLGSRDRSDR
jgi:hypothetical protein